MAHLVSFPFAVFIPLLFDTVSALPGVVLLSTSFALGDLGLLRRLGGLGCLGALSFCALCCRCGSK